MSEWRTVPFGSLCDITRGASPRPIHDFISDSGVPWVKISDATSDNSRFLSSTKQRIKVDGVSASVQVFPGDLILSNSATPGLPKFLRIEACIHDGWMLLRNFRELDKDFAYWLLLSERLKLVALGNGSVFTNLKTDILRHHLVLLPPLHEQKAIAHILGTLDDKIDQLRKTNSVLEDMASALFKSWFVDFDPVKAKQENRPTGLPKELDDLFPDSFEDSALGPIPTGWRVSKTGDELTVVGGTTPSTANPSYWDGGSHYWATPKDLSEQKLPIISSTSRLVTDQGLATISSRLLDPGSVLLSSRAPVGYLAVAEVPVAINQGFIAIKASSTTPTGFIYEWCKGNIEEFLKRSSGTTFLELSKSSFRQIPLVMPEADVVREYECHHTGLFKRVSSNIHQIRTLTNLRDTLLPKLISGDLRVPEAEQMVAELGL